MSQTSTGDVGEPHGARPGGASAASERTRSDQGGRPRTRAQRQGVFARLALFLRQVVAELRKVVRPTRNELVTYTTVCIVFVAVVMAYVSALDIGFGKLVLLVFGGGRA